MKRIIVTFLLALTAASAHAWTSYTSQQYGNTTYTNGYGQNGAYVNSTSNTYGNTTYSNTYGRDSQGNQVQRNCTTQQYGNAAYTNCY